MHIMMYNMCMVLGSVQKDLPDVFSIDPFV